MESEVSSVFDIMGRLAITPNQEHIDMALRLGRALLQWLGTPKTISWHLDGSMAEASFNQTMTLAVTAGLIGVETLVGDPNILELAFQRQIHVDFVPNAPVAPTTAQLVLDQHQTLVFTTRSANDTFAITQINDVPVHLQPGDVSLLATVSAQLTVDPTLAHVSPLINFGATQGLLLTPQSPTPGRMHQLSTLPGIISVTQFR